MAENILITICARAGSKGLPDKHLKELCGKPLIAWTAAYSFECKWRQVISAICTDDEKILKVALRYGVDGYIPRLKSLSKNKTPKIDVLRYALNWLENELDTQFKTIIDLDATNPLRRIKDIRNAYRAFVKGGYDSLSSVVEARKNPYYSMVEMGDGKARQSKYAERIFACRQELPQVYEQNANIYVYKREYLLDENNKSDIGDNMGIYIMPDWTFCDINTELDFKIVEMLMREYLL